jgi:hypothetical protein
MIIGIDPGLSGGIAILTKSGDLMLATPMPKTANEVSIKDLTALLKSVADHKCLAFVEQAQAMPKNGVVGMFRYGVGFGSVLGCLGALGVSYVLIRPRTWQGMMHKGTDADVHPKKRSLLVAERLFPERNFLASPRCKKPHDGMIDAALIAEYGRRSIQGEKS